MMTFTDCFIFLRVHGLVALETYHYYGVLDVYGAMQNRGS